MGIATENFTVLAGSWFTLVGVDNKVARAVEKNYDEQSISEGDMRSLPRVLLPSRFVHKAPLESTRKPCTTSATKARVLDILNNPRVALEKDILRTVPVTPRLSRMGMLKSMVWFKNTNTHFGTF